MDTPYFSEYTLLGRSWLRNWYGGRPGISEAGGLWLANGSYDLIQSSSGKPSKFSRRAQNVIDTRVVLMA